MILWNIYTNLKLNTDKDMEDKIYITWDDFHQHTKNLVQKLKEENCLINQIVAVSRGGLIPAGILAYELNVRNCKAINMSSYDGNIKRNDSDITLETGTLSGLGKDTLIVDDLADSGRTFNILKAIYPNAKYACVYAKPQGAKSADIYAVDLPEKWVVFPWD